MFRGAERFLALLSQLSDWTTPARLSAALGEDPDALVHVLERLREMDLVIADPPGPGEQLPTGLQRTDWNLIDLAMQRQTSRGGSMPEDPEQQHPLPAVKPVPPGPEVQLPADIRDLEPSLNHVLRRRHSIRTYGEGPLCLEDLSAFLTWTVRATGERATRLYPSGGARYPLELYVIANAVEGIEAGAHYYHPNRHSLCFLKPQDDHQRALNKEVRRAAGEVPNTDPAAVILITAVFQRTMSKYKRLALSLILKEVGGLFQTMYLVATALDLAPCAIGGGQEAENARWLGLDPFAESQVGCFLLGLPKRRPSSR